MKKIFHKISLGIIIICLLFIGFLYVNNDIGVRADNLETDIRKSQKISNDWSVDGSISDTMAAFISYPEDRNDHTFSVYVNRPGLSFGYFFRGGGDITDVENHIAKYTVENYDECAFISINSQKINRLEIDDGNTVQLIDIDSNKPFAIVLPVNAGNITFFNENGQIIDYCNHPL